MTKRRFFSTVWRVNAIVILLAGLGACALLMIAGAMMLRDVFQPRRAHNVVNVSPEQRLPDRTSLGDFTRIEGTQVFRAPLNVEQEYEMSMSSKEMTSTQNYLFYDAAADQSYWLRSGPLALISATHALPSREYDERVPVVATVYEIVERDTDGNQRLTDDDTKTVAISDASGRRLTNVLTGVTELHAAELLEPNLALILYTAEGKLSAVTVDLTSRKVARRSGVTNSQGPG